MKNAAQPPAGYAREPAAAGGRPLPAIADILVPVFAVIALGYLLTRTGFLSERALRDLNSLTYWVGLPSLLLQRVAGAPPEVASVAGLLAVTVGATGVAIAVGVLCGRLLGLAPELRGTFTQGVFRGNLAFIGLPVVMYTFSGAGDASSAIQASALLAFGPLVVIYNVAAVVVLLLAGRGLGGGALRQAATGLLTNPILIGCLGGLLLALGEVALPRMLDRTLAAIGQMALPLALLGIGGTLYTTRIRGRLGLAAAGALIKVLLVPATGLGLAWALGLSADHTRIALILLACPTAAASYVLARQLGGDGALASSMIVLSNLFALPAMALVLWAV